MIEDDVAVLGSDPSEMQVILNKLNNSAALFGMRFTPTNFKVLLQDWMGLSPKLILADEPINVVDHFNYLGSLISPGGLDKEEVTQRIAKARAAFTNLQHIWCRHDISLSLKGRVYNAVVRPVLLYGSEI